MIIISTYTKVQCYTIENGLAVSGTNNLLHVLTGVRVLKIAGYIAHSRSRGCPSVDIVERYRPHDAWKTLSSIP